MICPYEDGKRILLGIMLVVLCACSLRSPPQGRNWVGGQCEMKTLCYSPGQDPKGIYPHMAKLQARKAMEGGLGRNRVSVW